MSHPKWSGAATKTALAAVLIAACAYETHQRQLTIAPDPVACADGAGSCLLVTDPMGDSWTTNLDEIEGFTYQPGFTYELLVEEASQAAEIEAAAPPRLKLIRVLSRQASGATSEALSAELGGARWLLSAIEPSDRSAADWAASGITAEFDLAAGRLSGFAGCNRYFAAVTVAGDQMRVSDPASTRMACPEAAMALEQEYLQRLAQTSVFAVTGDRLELSLADGSGMAFRAEP
jgi:heat shock protein HslJ